SDSYRVVTEDSMHTFDTVHELRDAEVDDDARQRECVDTFEIELASHQLEHRIGRCGGRLVEVLVEAEREPGIRCPGDRRVQLRVVFDRERELEPLERTLDCGLRHLAVSLTGVYVPGREDITVDRNRPEQSG